MSMRFRITESPFLRENPNEPRHQGRWLPTSIRLYDTSRAFQCTVSESEMEAETAAFGYLARALIFEQRVRKRTFGYPRQAP